jgi:hypothetical protein
MAVQTEIEARLAAHLQEQFQTKQALPESESLRYVNDHVDARLGGGWVHALLGRQLDEVHICRSTRG